MESVSFWKCHLDFGCLKNHFSSYDFTKVLIKQITHTLLCKTIFWNSEPASKVKANNAYELAKYMQHNNEKSIFFQNICDVYQTFFLFSWQSCFDAKKVFRKSKMAAIKTLTDANWIVKKGYYMHIVISAKENPQGNRIFDNMVRLVRAGFLKAFEFITFSMSKQRSAFQSTRSHWLCIYDLRNWITFQQTIHVVQSDCHSEKALLFTNLLCKSSKLWQWKLNQATLAIFNLISTTE